MKIEIELPDYDGNAMDIVWEKGAKCTAEVHGTDVVIKANVKGLISLAKQMLYMSFNNLPKGAHVHYHSFLTQSTDNNYELLIEKEM